MKNKVRNKSIKIIFSIIFIIIFLLPNFAFAQMLENDKELIEDKKDIFKDITAPNLLIAETKTGKILYERRADERIYPASVTKLLTAILVVENCALDEIVTVSENAVMSVPSGYVNANLQVGEEITVEDLLYVLLIHSANDAANALAEHIGGSIESFSTMMNSKAKELGCTGSNFTNPSGLHQKQHYITTRDLFYISQEAISKDLIKKIIKEERCTLPSTNKYKKTDRIFTTTNYMIRKSLTKYYCDYCIGGKTGYTGEAKNCVVEYANKDGIELTAIVMGQSAVVKGQKFLDSKKMFEYIFKNYKNNKVAIKDKKHETIDIANGTKETRNLDVLYKDDVNILQEKGSNGEIEKSVEYTNVNAPIIKGDVVGKITYKYDGITYSTELVANSNVEEIKELSNVLKILIVVLLIYIIYNLKKSKKKYGNHGKKYKKKLNNMKRRK